MLTIIHGDNISVSRKYFLDQKQLHPDRAIVDGEKISLTDLIQILEGGSLFDESKTVFIENILSKKKKTTESKELLSYLQKHTEENTIYIWEGKELEKSILITFKTATIRPFKLPQTLFLFLDSIKPSNGKTLINLFHQTLESTEPEMIFFMLVRQIRFLLALSKEEPIHPRGGFNLVPQDSNEVLGEIDELKRLAPWQKSKLQNQAAAFAPAQLISFYKKLFSIELAQKTGNLTAPLPSVIDFLLLEI